MTYKVHVYVDGREVAAREVRRGEELVLGRESSCDLVVLDRSVSRRHCTLAVEGDGLEVRDLGSANGLYFEGRQLDRVLLRDGDQVTLGMARIRVSNTATHTGMIPISGLLGALSDDGAKADEDSDSGSGLLKGPGTPLMFRESDDAVSSLSEGSIGPEYRALEKDRLLLLVELGKSLGQSLDLEGLLHRILDHLFEVLPVRRAVIALTEDGETFTARVTRPSQENEGLSQVASQGVLKSVVASREGRIIEDASLDRKLKSNVSVVASNIRAAVCAPIVVGNRCLGAIYADYPGRPRLYTRPDLDFLTAFASIAGVSLDNSRMTEQLRRADRLKRDLEIAAEIQQGILPNEAFDFEGLEIDWTYVPSLNVGGDFYDVIDLGDGRVAFLIGDVSGKSVPAALYMARAISILRATVDGERSPGEVLKRTNRLLGFVGGERMIFATAMLCVIDGARRRLIWASAGHNAALLRRSEDGSVEMLESTGPPMGVLEDVEFETREVPLSPGCYLTLYTDGLVEVRDVAGKELGIARVNAIVSRYLDEPVGSGTKALLEAVRDHHRNSPHALDDVAILNVRVL